MFTEDSVTLFAEQANIVDLNQPYRPRILRLRQIQTLPAVIEVQYYMCKDLMAVRGAGQNQALLKQLTPQDLEFLPDCRLEVTVELVAPDSYKFITTNPSGCPCKFTYQNQTYQVSLGFAVTAQEMLVYDKGIDPKTGKAIWGALMGPYCFQKRKDFSSQLLV